MVERLPVGSPPFGLRTASPPFGFDGVPLKVWVPGRRVADWRLHEGSAAPVPQWTVPVARLRLAVPARAVWQRPTAHR